MSGSSPGRVYRNIGAPPHGWSVNACVATNALVIGCVLALRAASSRNEPVVVVWALAVVAGARTFLDYRFGWDNYWENDEWYNDENAKVMMIFR